MTVYVAVLVDMLCQARIKNKNKSRNHVFPFPLCKLANDDVCVCFVHMHAVPSSESVWKREDITITQ